MDTVKRQPDARRRTVTIYGFTYMNAKFAAVLVMSAGLNAGAESLVDGDPEAGKAQSAI